MLFTIIIILYYWLASILHRGVEIIIIKRPRTVEKKIIKITKTITIGKLHTFPRITDLNYGDVISLLDGRHDCVAVIGENFEFRFWSN